MDSTHTGVDPGHWLDRFFVAPHVRFSPPNWQRAPRSAAERGLASFSAEMSCDHDLLSRLTLYGKQSGYVLLLQFGKWADDQSLQNNKSIVQYHKGSGTAHICTC